jgi:hypothetical protein
MNDPTDRRRYGVIETRFRQHGQVAIYTLSVAGQIWAQVEWSRSRNAWCVQDASGRCLAHCDAIYGQDVDAQTAVALARRMIVDGRMPSPEEARERLAKRLAADAQQAATPAKTIDEWFARTDAERTRDDGDRHCSAHTSGGIRKIWSR